MLGKRMAEGWYPGANQAEIGKKLQELYSAIESEGTSIDMDNFAIAMEDISGAGFAIGEWRYTSDDRVDGLRKLTMNQSD